MRIEVLRIIRLEWPNKTSPKGRIRYGNLDLYAALARMVRYAEDIGDEELYEDALNAAKEIQDPTPDREGKLCYDTFGIKNREHDAIHNKRPRVFIFKEKHGDWMYDASTPLKASKAVLTVLERRLEDMWFMEELPKEAVSDQMDLLKSNKVPETEADKARRVLKIARSDKPGALIVAGKMAYSMLMDRSGFEYEQFDIESLSVAEFDLKKEPPF